MMSLRYTVQEEDLFCIDFRRDRDDFCVKTVESGERRV